MPKVPRSPFQRQVTVQRTMSRNAAGGRTSLVAPPPPPPPPLEPLPERPVPYLPFSYGNFDTAVAVSESSSYTLRRSGPLGVWVATLEAAGSSSTTVDVKLEGVVLDTVTLASTDTYEELDLTGEWGSAGERLRVEVTAAGTGAEGLVVLAPIV